MTANNGHSNGRARPPRENSDGTISLLGARREVAGPSLERLTLETDRGNLWGYLHPAAPDDRIGPSVVVWVGGARGGTEGPAGGLYHTLAERLAPQGIASLRLEYRHPNNLKDCITDVLVALAWLEDSGAAIRAALVGHSFGGAVVIDAGALNPIVKDVIALSSQTYGADLVGDVSPRTLLLIHGEADTVLPAACSRQLYAAAQEPRELVIYPGAGHGLDECAADLHERVFDHLRTQLQPLAP